MTPGQKHLLDLAIARRGTECEFCGRQAKPIGGTGKKRYAHICPHGLPCARGVRLLGWHANHPTCGKCRTNHETLYSKQEAERDAKRGIASLGPISDAIKNFRRSPK